MAHQKKYAFVIEVDRCIDCKACMVACEVENQVPLGHHRNWVKASPLQGAFPNLTQNFVAGNCMHCAYPPCVQVCPTAASYQRADGLVLIDQDKCIGCRFCIEACPYGARYFDESRGVADKCSACVHRLDVGLAPACVETCVGGARHFGDLNDPRGDVAQWVASGRAKPFHPETGTGPKLFYVSKRAQPDSRFPVNEKVSGLVWFRRDLERPVLLGLLGAAIALTAAAFRAARRNALRHFKEVEAQSAEDKPPKSEGADHGAK